MPGNVKTVQLPELCPIALEATDRFGDDTAGFELWFEEHAKTCKACKELVDVIATVMLSSDD